MEVGEHGSGASGLDVVYYAASEPRMVTVLLPGRWAGAEVEWHPGEGVRIERAGEKITLPHTVE